jgi:hypothetical protein
MASARLYLKPQHGRTDHRPAAAKVYPGMERATIAARTIWISSDR